MFPRPFSNSLSGVQPWGEAVFQSVPLLRVLPSLPPSLPAPLVLFSGWSLMVPPGKRRPSCREQRKIPPLFVSKGVGADNVEQKCLQVKGPMSARLGMELPKEGPMGKRKHRHHHHHHTQPWRGNSIAQGLACSPHRVVSKPAVASPQWVYVLALLSG